MSSAVPKLLRVGQVIKKSARGALNIVKVRVQLMKLNTNLNMYVSAKNDHWCVDEGDKCKLGDIVVLRNIMGKEVSKNVDCKVESIMYQVGNTIDPLTNRPCKGTEFIDTEAREKEMEQRDIEDIMVTNTIPLQKPH